jgi:hypothetical protein
MAEDDIVRIKQSFAKMGIHYDNDDDYLEAWHNLIGFFDILIQMDMEQKRQQSDMEKHPENL